jgi:hypothetical protein
MLTYCDDPSHTANPVGPIITDPDPVAVLADDVYIDKLFYQKPGDPHWRIHHYAPKTVGKDGQARQQSPDGTLLPPLARRTKAQQLAAWAEDAKWTPRCRRCGQRGGRWIPESWDEVFDQLATERGATGVSLRMLDLIKHSGIRSIPF